MTGPSSLSMEDKVFLATAKTEEAPTAEQLDAVVEHGWQAVPDPAEESGAIFLLRPVQSKEEAAGQFADLVLDERLAPLFSGLVSNPPIENPLQASGRPPDASVRAPSDLPKKPDDPSKSDGAAEEPEKKDGPQPNAFPTIPEYLWKSLNPESQDELAKKLVEYVVNRPDTAAYGSSFDDAALFAHLNPADRPDHAKKILEQKHGMTGDQVRRELLVDEFQIERVNLMKQAVASAVEINEHLKKWRTLSENVVPFLVWSTAAAAAFVLALFALVFLGRISGWEMAVLVFVFALMAVSPATLLLVGRPLKGLDEWSPNKQEKKAEEAAKEEPARDKGKSEEKAGK